nr:hypothetical protein [Pediococcus stilesii]
MDLTLMKEIIQKTNKLALSTSYNDQADVRIVNFVWQEETPGKLYFSSVKTGPALKVYAKNPDVAFITIPDDGASGNPYLKATHVKIKKVAQNDAGIAATLPPDGSKLSAGMGRNWTNFNGF